jgi:cation diffusion facilitator CzcD-associated flavoprotein CzcO
MSPADDPVVVVGAGPYGVSVAAHLRARGVPVRVFGTPMQAWREQMPTGMVLKSTPLASSISAPTPGYTLPDYCRATPGEPRLRTDWDTVPIETFVRYGLWFTQRLVPDLEPVRVVSVDRHRRAGRTTAAFDIKLDTGEAVRARAVVVASGLSGYAHLPRALAAACPDGPSARGPISHASQHADLTGFAGRRVVVVGGGAYALESATLLHEAGASSSVLARGQSVGFGDPPSAGPHWRPNTPLGRAWSLYAVTRHTALFRHLPVGLRSYLVRNMLGPRGAWWLRDRFAGNVPVRMCQRILSVATDGHQVTLRIRDHEGRVDDLVADHVLAGTGYRVDLDALDFLSSELRSVVRRTGRSPWLDRHLQTSVPGLYVTGLAAAATYGPTLRFVCGTDFTSPTITAAITRNRATEPAPG